MIHTVAQKRGWSVTEGDVLWINGEWKVVRGIVRLYVRPGEERHLVKMTLADDTFYTAGSEEFVLSLLGGEEN